MRFAYLLTIMIVGLLAGRPAAASPMPWEKRTEDPKAQHVPQPGPEWDAIFPKGFSFDIPPTRYSQARARAPVTPYESFDRLRVRSDGTAASEIDYLTNITQILLTTSTDDVLRSARNPDVKVNYDERLRFFLGPAWKAYELYLTTQKNRLSAQLSNARGGRIKALRVTGELTPATRHLTFADGRGTFAAEGWLNDGVYNVGTRSHAFLLKIEFITDRASPDIIITKWDMTIKDKK